MKRYIGLSAATAMASLVWVSGVQAQSRETVSTTGPNRDLLHSGLFALGIPYVVSVVVATQSDHEGDKNLYLPVVGPWMDLGQRGDCGGAGQTTCRTDTVYKALLVGDGILQGIGALEIIGAFMFPETRNMSTATREPRVFVAPAYMGRSAYGISAVGAF
jgi:hypothetical protein